jgi:hypothetical protein
MTPEADRLLAVALKKISLRDGFSPAELGARVGLNKMQADAAARELANAGVLVIGFDRSAEFSDDYRRAKTAPAPVRPMKKKPRTAKPANARNVYAGANAHPLRIDDE